MPSTHSHHICIYFGSLYQDPRGTRYKINSGSFASDVEPLAEGLEEVSARGYSKTGFSLLPESRRPRV
jgi:hypothetical protein